MMEVMIVVFIIAAIVSAIVPTAMNRVANANYTKTVAELTAIGQAAMEFYIANGGSSGLPASCPSINQLSPQYMPNVYGDATSPFHTNYAQPVCVNNMVTTSVLIPTGIAENKPLGQLTVVAQGQQDKISISNTINNRITGWLSYKQANPS